MNLRISTASAVIAAACLSLGTGSATAAVVGLSPNIDLSLGAYTVDLGGGTSFTFSDSGERGGFFGFALPGVQTTGSAMVASDGPPFFAEFRPATYFTDVGRQPFIDGSLLATFLSYSDVAPINAEVDSFIALSFTMDGGTHYGFARLAGLTLFDFAYETTAGMGIQATDGPFNTPAPVPLPAALPLLAGAIAGLGLLKRRRAKAA